MYICTKIFINNLKLMLKHIQLKRGLDIPVKGHAQPQIVKTIASDIIAVKPTDFKNVTPKLAVREGDAVKAGTIVFTDKYRPEIGFASPCSGTVESIVRGEKRKLLEIRIKVSATSDYISFEKKDVQKASREELVKALLESGLWPAITQRPYGTIANPNDAPRAIFISAFNSAPLAPDYNFTLKDEAENLQTAINVLKKLTKGDVVIGLDSNNYATSPFYKLDGVKRYAFNGPHPAGNVGVQINNIAPVCKGEVVWTVDPVYLAAIGKLFNKGVYDVSKLVAVTGSKAKQTGYVKCLPGAAVKDFAEFIDTESTELYDQHVENRYISGDVLTGENVGMNGFLGFYNHQLTVINEGNYAEMFGWAKPFRPNKFSVSRSYFSWLTPKKRYPVDTNLNGGPRAFVVTGLYEQVVPMDIYPVYLLKAILAEDIDKMEQLGMYEVVEEDFALCEYVCPSKIDVQDIITKGINIMLKEMA